MRNLVKVLISHAILATQVANPLLHTAAASVQAPAQADGVTQIVALDVTSPRPVKLTVRQPDFDADVLAPLKAAQAAEARQNQAVRAQRFVRQAVLTGPVTGDVWYQLRLCESGNNYQRNSGNGYYGAYQYSISTWGNYMGYARADLAPPAVQDARARETQAARGWYPWPGCARKLGLL